MHELISHFDWFALAAQRRIGTHHILFYFWLFIFDTSQKQSIRRRRKYDSKWPRTIRWNCYHFVNIFFAESAFGYGDECTDNFSNLPNKSIPFLIKNVSTTSRPLSNTHLSVQKWTTLDANVPELICICGNALAFWRHTGRFAFFNSQWFHRSNSEWRQSLQHLNSFFKLYSSHLWNNQTHRFLFYRWSHKCTKIMFAQK